MFESIEPPTEKISLTCQILKLLMFLTFLQALFMVYSHEIKALLYGLSVLFYIFTILKISYFGCILNQIFNLSMIWFLLLQMAITLKSGLYEVYLSSEGIYKMSSLIVSIISLYFNFLAYKDFKQISLQIFEYQNAENQEIIE